MIVTLKMNPAEYGCKLQGFPTTPQFAKGRPAVVYLVTGINCGARAPESPNHYISIGCCSRERRSVDVCLK